MDGDIRLRATHEQLLTVLEYMEKHGDLGRPLPGPQGRMRSDKLWVELTNIVNSVGGGVIKSIDKWKKVWADSKTKTKKKASLLRKNPKASKHLSAYEERVLALAGNVAEEGSSSIKEIGFERSQTDSTQLAAPIAIKQIIFEIGDESSQLSPQASTSQETTRQTSCSFAPLLNVESLDAPSPDTAPSTLSSRKRPLPSHSPVAPAAGRQSRSGTPESPQSGKSSPKFSRRRRRALTPFDRAVKEFTAVEMRRLELEETRLKQQHERDMLALEVERERNGVLGELVNVALNWLEYQRGRDDADPLNTD